MPDLVAGASIAGRYKLEERLDTGGVASVWKAVDQELARDVAVKILLTPTPSDAEFIEAFRAEAQAEAGLKHPNIVEVFDWGHDGDANYVVMELLAGHTVRQALDTSGPMEWQIVLGVGRQIAGALAYAHQSGIAHGTIDAHRIVVEPAGHATAIGFGLSCRGQCEVPPTPDADTYALGGVLYEMLAGMSPFSARPAEIPANQPWPRPLREVAPQAPHELDRIITKAIAADPAERYTSAGELAADLDALAKPKSRAWLWWMLAALAVIAVGAATWYLSSQQKVVVPDVTGKTQIEASSVLASAGLKLVTAGQGASTAVPTDTVIAENPAAGQSVRKGSQVGVTISTGLPRVAVPSVVGVPLQAASAAISQAGLVVGTVTRANSTTYPVDAVISAFPSAGMQAVVGSPVDLTVSAGQATVTMPDVRGASQTSATNKLTNLGLKVDVGQQYSSQPVGTVVSQGPAGGTTVPGGGTVVISVSRGRAPVKIPDLVDSSPSSARTILLNLGLVPVTSTEASGTDPSRKGIVVGTTPESGETVSAGTRVTIHVGN